VCACVCINSLLIIIFCGYASAAAAAAIKYHVINLKAGEATEAIEVCQSV